MHFELITFVCALCADDAGDADDADDADDVLCALSRPRAVPCGYVTVLILV